MVCQNIKTSKGATVIKAIWNNQTIAESPKEDLIYIEGNWYFPPTSIKEGFLTKSDTPYTCPWKGECQYFNIEQDGVVNQDVAWSYPEPKPTAIDIVKKDFSNYVAFWREVQVTESDPEPDVIHEPAMV